MPWINQEKCIGCGSCVDVCPVGAIFMKNGKAVVDQDKCIHCGKCLNVCPKEAIRPNSENPDFRKHKFGSHGERFGFSRRKQM